MLAPAEMTRSVLWGADQMPPIGGNVEKVKEKLDASQWNVHCLDTKESLFNGFNARH